MREGEVGGGAGRGEEVKRGKEERKEVGRKRRWGTLLARSKEPCAAFPVIT